MKKIYDKKDLILSVEKMTDLNIQTSYSIGKFCNRSQVFAKDNLFKSQNTGLNLDENRGGPTPMPFTFPILASQKWEH